MSGEKGEAKKKKGLTWAEAAKQVNRETQWKLQSADLRLSEFTVAKLLFLSVTILLLLGIGKIRRTSYP